MREGVGGLLLPDQKRKRKEKEKEEEEVRGSRGLVGEINIFI